MSFYIRKSIKAGPFRLNLSKSGIGISTGIRGLRVGNGPRGAYVHMGRNGVYYRQTLSSTARRAVSPEPAPTAQRQLLPPVSEVVLDDATGATSVELSEASSSDLVSHINEAAARLSLFPLIVLLWLPLITIPAAIWLRARDKARRTVAVFYDVNDAPAERFQRLADSFVELQNCLANWYVTARGAVATTQQFKVHAGASSLIQRIRGKANVSGPQVLATNIAIPSLHGGKRSVFFLPDRILVRDGKRFADIAYSECHTSGAPTDFIEDRTGPQDSVQVGTTWKYVNKSGGPDRRYKDNRQLPIMQYGELTLSTESGFHFVWQSSKAAVASTMAAAISAM